MSRARGLLAALDQQESLAATLLTVTVGQADDWARRRGGYFDYFEVSGDDLARLRKVVDR